MNLKKVLILSVAGLVLWSAWGSEVHADENIKGSFAKENGEYLIESGEQLELLSGMVANREEIEPGVDAATQRVKLCWDVNHHRNHYSVTIADCNFVEDSYYQYMEGSDALRPFLDLFGDETGAIMRQSVSTA